jgi:hypothetical protein
MIVGESTWTIHIIKYEFYRAQISENPRIRTAEIVESPFLDSVLNCNAAPASSKASSKFTGGVNLAYDLANDGHAGSQGNDLREISTVPVFALQHHFGHEQ